MSRSSWKAQVLIIMTKHNQITAANPNLTLAEIAKKLNSNPATISKITQIHKNLKSPAVANALTLNSAYEATKKRNSKTISEISNSAAEIFNSDPEPSSL